jgi:hypothetical protein
MTRERPTAAVLGAIVALAFVVAFAAAAVLRPQSAPPAAGAAVAAPAAASEETRVASVAVPSLSREPAMPGLRLPVRRHRVVKHHAPAVVRPPVAVAVATAVPTAAPTAVPTPVPTARPVVVVPRRVVAPAKPTTPNVGQSFDSKG